MVDQAELGRRKTLALQAIHAAHSGKEHEYDVTIFITHHLEEIEPAYWLKHTGKEKPSPQEVLELLVLHHHWTPWDGDDPDSEDDEDGLQILDFTLPEGATQYVVCVEFSEQGEVDDIRMES